MSGEDDESGATATTIFIGNDTLLISHVGDSCAVRSKTLMIVVLFYKLIPWLMKTTIID